MKASGETMTREKMRAIQALPTQQIVRVHSCACGQPLVRVAPRDAANRYRCTRCGRTV